MALHQCYRRSIVAVAILGVALVGCSGNPPDSSSAPDDSASVPDVSEQPLFPPEIGIVTATEGSLYSGPSTLASDAPPPDFDEALPFTDTFVRARVLSIGRAHLNTGSGEFVTAQQPVGFFPFTPVTFEIEELVVQRPRSVVKKDVKVGQRLAIDLPGGSVTVAMTGDIAATMFLANDKALDPTNPEKETPVAPTDVVNITIAYNSGLSLAVDDEVVLGLRKGGVEWVTNDGNSVGRPLLSIANGASSVVVLDGDAVVAASRIAPGHIPKTARELRDRVASLKTSTEPAK
jgi:hypothetical protein